MREGVKKKKKKGGYEREISGRSGGGGIQIKINRQHHFPGLTRRVLEEGGNADLVFVASTH